jgi:uncharacterized protein (TIGR00297 family)
MFKILQTPNDVATYAALASVFILSVCAFRLHLLTRGGTIAACLVGTLSVLFGGLPALGLLFLFFITSNVLGHWRKEQKQILGFEKGGQRDHWQVFANGGPAAIGLMAGVLIRGLTNDHHLGLTLFAVGLAEANADTWATEIGSVSGSAPKSLVTGQLVSPGRSGGVTFAGTAAAAMGAALIAIAVAAAFPGQDRICVITVVSLTGFWGSLIDSVLGATVQCQFRDATGAMVEKGSDSAQPVQGLRWLNNDAVNFLAGTFSVTLSALILLLK